MKTKYSIDIEAEYGSEFQKECAEESLEILIKTWALFRMTTHKKNKIIYSVKKL